MPKSLMKAPSAMLESASIEPIERSKPPASITKVRPMETTQRIAALVSSASMFPEVKKRSCVTEKATNRTTSRTRDGEEALPGCQPGEPPEREPSRREPGRTPVRGSAAPSRSLMRRRPSPRAR